MVFLVLLNPFTHFIPYCLRGLWGHANSWVSARPRNRITLKSLFKMQIPRAYHNLLNQSQEDQEFSKILQGISVSEG